MSLYFKDEMKEEKKLSEYLEPELKEEKEEIRAIKLSQYLEKDENEFKGNIFSQNERIARTEYIMEILGDVSLEKDIYNLFIIMFQRICTKYDVLTKRDTIKAIYEIVKKHPYLTPKAIDEIWTEYIKDLFEQCQLSELLELYIEQYGKSDKVFTTYLDTLRRISKEHQEKYEEEAMMLDELKDTYSEHYIAYLKRLITKEHYRYDDITSILPEPSLVEKDEQHLLNLSKRTRIFLNCCNPLSYKMMHLMLDDEELTKTVAQPIYIINSNKTEDATFTKQEYIESVKKEKIKKYIK